MDTKETLRKIGTLGGNIRINPSTRRYYTGNNTPGGNMSKEKLFGQGAHGPLLIGMPNPSGYEEEATLRLNVSDTKATLIRELVEQSRLTRREAEDTVNALINSGKLVEVSDRQLGKILVWR